jgi:stage V sporulation protein D (sporulation-specific penicillin-binding protein)
MADILPYLGIEPDYTLEELANMDAAVPNVIGLTLEQAKATLKKQGLAFQTVGDEETVTAQVPAPGQSVPGDSEILLYFGLPSHTEQVAVPDFGQMNRQAASDAAEDLREILEGASHRALLLYHKA